MTLKQLLLNNIGAFIAALGLIMWAGTATYGYLTTESVTRVIAVTPSGVRQLAQDEILPEEYLAFIKDFISYRYSLSPLNVKDNLGFYSLLLAENYYDSIRPRLDEVEKSVVERETLYSFDKDSISAKPVLSRENHFLISFDLKMSIRRRVEPVKNIKLIVHIAKNPNRNRTLYGLEVRDVEEIHN